jgi:hypothetical protein
VLLKHRLVSPALALAIVPIIVRHARYFPCLAQRLMAIDFTSLAPVEMH